jgi:hypothetical protein
MVKREKIENLAKLQGELLREHKVGHPDWYAEMLVCAALDGHLALTNNPKHDVRSDSYGTVQVKSRVDGTDTTQNRTNFGKYKPGDFDFAAIVIFEADYTIKGAVLIQQSDVLELVRAAGHVRWGDVASHPRSLCIKEKLQKISGERT